MSLPVTAARIAIPRIAAWLSTARISSAKAFTDFVKAHPAVSSTIASLGVSGVIDAALNGDEDSIAALNAAAAHVGIGSDGNTGFAESTVERVERAVAQVGQLFKDDSVITISGEEADRTEQIRDLAKFVRSEISASPEYVIRYHAMMREFMDMDPASVQNMVRSY